jgi:predicted nucleotidyltransferase
MKKTVPPYKKSRSGTLPASSRSKAVLDFSKRVAQQFSPEKIILFGSQAAGNASPDSDVDIMVVLDHEGHPALKAAEIRRAVPAPFSLDLIVRSQSRLQERIKLGDPFISNICSNGIVLYESAHA